MPEGHTIHRLARELKRTFGGQVLAASSPQGRFAESAALRPEDAHYVYRRAGQPCRVCGTTILTDLVKGRNLFWCPHCQGGASPVPSG